MYNVMPDDYYFNIIIIIVSIITSVKLIVNYYFVINAVIIDINFLLTSLYYIFVGIISIYCMYCIVYLA